MPFTEKVATNVGMKLTVIKIVRLFYADWSYALVHSRRFGAWVSCSSCRIGSGIVRGRAEAGDISVRGVF